MAVCRSCGATIRWERTSNGKVIIPLDPTPVATGNLCILDNGRVVSSWGVPAEAFRYVTHFATCPNASDHRKRGETWSGPSEHDVAKIDDIMKGYGDWWSAVLLRLCQKADKENLAKLRLGFPEHVALYERWARSG